MAPLSFVTLDVFTKTRFAGNPLAIVRVPHDVDLSLERMQSIAREFNLSETVFLLEASQDQTSIPEWNIHIFMIDRELPFAGHPTIGTACHALSTLANNASHGRLICKAGPIDVTFNSGVAYASIPHNVHVHTTTPFTLDNVYSFQPILKSMGVKPISMDIVSPVRGMNFVCIELSDLQALAALHVTGVAPAAQLDPDWKEGAVGSYFYVLTTSMPMGEEPVRIRTRMFKATFEDPATGSAACALSSFLAMKLKRRRTLFSLTQAVEMGRRSDITVELTLTSDLTAVEQVVLSGSSVKVMEGTIDC